MTYKKLGLIMLILLIAPFISADILYEHNINASSPTATGGRWFGQNFTIGVTGNNVDFNLVGIGVWVNSSGSSTYCNYTIWNGDFTQALVSNTTDCSEVTGYPINITMPTEITLLASTGYAFTIEGSDNNIVQVRNEANSYDGGIQFYSADTISWVEDYNADLWFIMYGAGEETFVRSINLISPDGSTISSNDVTFSAKFNITKDSNTLGYNWTNATFYVWNGNTIFNKTTVDLANINNTNYSLVISGFSNGNYKWNALGCYKNSTYSDCLFSLANNTFSWRPFNISNQSYSHYVYETDRQRFNLSIFTIPDILSVTTKLNYNGELYDANTSCVGGSCNIISEIDIPLINVGNSLNRTFYWQMTLYDGTSSYVFNTSSSSLQQNVTRIHLEKCDGTYTIKTLNFTAYDETNLTSINPFKIAGTFYTWLGSGTIKRNQSFDESSVSELSLCITPIDRTQLVDAQIEYSLNDENITYVPRNYYFQGNGISNLTQNISLYLLSATESTSFIIKVQDQNFASVSNALVYIQRYYPSDGTFKTVQVAKTDDNGETVGFYQTETADYKHLIIRNGTILLLTNQQKVIGKETPYTLTFTVGDMLDAPWGSYIKNPNIYSVLSYNDTSKIVSFTYIDITGASTLGRLTVIKQSSSNYSKSVICNVSSTEPSATLTCDMSGYDGTFIAYGYVESSITDLLNFIITTARDIFGREGLFMGLFIILVAGFAFIWNPTAGVIAINAAVIFTNLIGFLSVSPIFIFGMIAVSIMAIILLKT